VSLRGSRGASRGVFLTGYLHFMSRAPCQAVDGSSPARAFAVAACPTPCPLAIPLELESDKAHIRRRARDESRRAAAQSVRLNMQRMRHLRRVSRLGWSRAHLGAALHPTRPTTCVPARPKPSFAAFNVTGGLAVRTLSQLCHLDECCPKAKSFRYRILTCGACRASGRAPTVFHRALV